jgi:hypothetical protein
MSLLSICTVCTLSVLVLLEKIDHHDCVYVMIMNKSPCQVCVCISESGRNKTQLAGGKGFTEIRKKNTRQAGE